MATKEETLKSIMKQVEDVCKGPLFDECKELATKAVNAMAINASPTRTVKNIQLIMISAMILAIFLDNTSADEGTRDIAMTLHNLFFKDLMENMEKEKETI